MIRFLFALVATLGVATVIAVVQRVGPALGRVWRAILIGLAALLALVGLALGIAGVENDALWAAIPGVVLMLLALRLGWSARRQPSSGAFTGAIGRSGLPSTADIADPHWKRFEKQLGSSDRNRAQRARLAISGFLAERGSPALTAEHQSLMVSLEKRVPELLDTCVERCRRARHGERGQYLNGTLERLEQIGAEAERARLAVREADDRRLDTLHRYFDQVTPPKALPDNR